MKSLFDALLANEAPDAMVIASPEGVVLHWNKPAEDLFGYESSEAIGRLLCDLVVPPDRLEEQRSIQKEAISSGACTFESVRQCKDGSLLQVVISTKALRDAKGQVEYLISSKTDVTQLKVRRDANFVEARFRELLESTPDAIVIANATGRIVFANTQSDKLFGYEPKELLGKSIETLVPERYRNTLVRHRSQWLSLPRKRGLSPGLELYGLRKYCDEFPAEISLSPIKTDEGTLIMCAIRDIADRKRIEQALNEKNVELQNAAEAKNLFLANMSHELRTPLNGVIGFAEFLLTGKPGPLNPKQLEYVTDILNSGKHLLQLINDVLDLAKVESGKMELLPEHFSLRTAIQEICSVLKPLAQRKHIRLTVEVSAELMDVFLDQPKFKQVLYNLSSNAVKFTDEGGTVKINVCPQGPEHFKLTVTDSGIGIKPKDLKRLFTEFEQLESGATRHYEGTGLGLALTRRIVTLQEGSIDVKSRFGVGSTFTVVLPLQTERPAA